MTDKSSVVNRRRIVEVNGKKIELEALTLQDWVQAEEEALNDYRRKQISVWTKNADLLPEDMREQKVMDAFNMAQELTVDDLPMKEMETPIIDPHTGNPIMRRGRPKMAAQPVPYTAWWLSNTVPGNRTAIFLSMRRSDPSVTIDYADKFFQNMQEDQLDMLAQHVGDLSEPKVGN